MHCISTIDLYTWCLLRMLHWRIENMRSNGNRSSTDYFCYKISSTSCGTIEFAFRLYVFIHFYFIFANSLTLSKVSRIFNKINNSIVHYVERELIEIKEWLEWIMENDPDEKCRALGAMCYINLKTFISPEESSII